MHLPANQYIIYFLEMIYFFLLYLIHEFDLIRSSKQIKPGVRNQEVKILTLVSNGGKSLSCKFQYFNTTFLFYREAPIQGRAQTSILQKKAHKPEDVNEVVNVGLINIQEKLQNLALEIFYSIRLNFKANLDLDIILYITTLVILIMLKQFVNENKAQGNLNYG